MYNPFARSRWMIASFPAVSAVVVSVGLLSSCSQVDTANSTTDFTATAATTYTWQVEYIPRSPNQDRPNDRRIEKFESTTVVSENGIRPEAAGSGPDSQGLWWPVLPPEPTVDEIEDRRRKGETPRSPEIIKSEAYRLTFDHAGEQKNLPTDYNVYRQAVKAFEKDRTLMLTLSPQDRSVTKAEIQ